MAKVYRALSNIVGGKTDENGVLVEEVRFPYGSIVQGLEPDVMKDLWDRGVLEELEMPDAQTTKTPSSPESAGQGGPAAGSTGEQTGSSDN